MQSINPAAIEKLDKLVESLFQKLEKLRATAHAMADEASMEVQIQLLDTGEGQGTNS